MPFANRSKNVRRSTSRDAVLASASTLELVALEARRLMHADPNDPTHVDEVPTGLGVFPVINANLNNAGTTAGGGTTGAAAASSPLSAIPVLSSRPTATAKLYLDFGGDTTAAWGSYAPGTTPAYDTDGDATTFSDAELANIRQIFDRVAEKYSPFNINVTTVDPGTYANRSALKVVFGGDGAWLGAQAGGVSYVGAFTNSAPNTVFVFPKMLANGYAQYSAEAAAHEAGHAFGLQHQSSYSGTTKTAEYAPANAAGDAPIMGSSYTARRGMWWSGQSSLSSTSYQDDLAVIGNTATNGFGYRADDFGSTLAAASTLSLNGTTVSTAGVIEKTSDADVFSFTTGAGAVNFAATPSTAGGMLDAKLDLRDASGAVVASSDAGLSESLSASLAAGTYYITVSSHGGYGDVGQYTLTGTVAAPATQPPVTPQPTAPAAPSNLAARTLTTTSVRLSWVDNSTSETGFKVYASRDNRTWSLLGTVGANVTSVDHTGIRRNVSYYYKIRATNAVGDSADSNVATASTALSAAIAAKGDANLDGVVDFNDLVSLSQHYNTTGGMTWANGDFTGDGTVDFNDLVYLSQQYNTGTPVAADTPDDGEVGGTLTPVATDPAAGTNATATTPAKAAVVKKAAPTPVKVSNVKKPAAVFSVRSIATARRA